MNNDAHDHGLQHLIQHDYFCRSLVQKRAASGTVHSEKLIACPLLKVFQWDDKNLFDGKALGLNVSQ